MMISAGWLILVFSVGAYVGLTLLAALVVSSREPAQTDAQQLGDDPGLALIAQWWSEEPVAHPNPGRASHEGT